MFTSIPLYNVCITPVEIRKSFQARIRPDMTDKEKADLQAEYNAAVEALKKRIEAEAKEVAKQNTKLFLADPAKAVNHLKTECNPMFTVGEWLRIYAIGTVKRKRVGKGTLIGKNTLAEGILSNFVVTATIGPHELVEELSSRNDRQWLEGLDNYVLGHLAQQLASSDQSDNTERKIEKRVDVPKPLC